MRISQLAERSGVPATTLRFYEGAGLLHADRTPAGYRLYGEDAVERLAFIGAAKHLGLPLEEVGELLRVWEAGACRDVKADLRPRIAARLVEAESRAAELAAFTASLHTALEHLDALPDRASPCDPECGFLAPSAPASVGTRVVDVVLAPSRQVAEAEAEGWRTAPVACSLTGDGLYERTAQWREAVDGAVRTSVPDGLRLTLPVVRAARVAELAAAEQKCCPFFDFRLHLDGPRLHLEVRAPADGAGLLTDLFGPAA
ncbi:MerR family transcriptional regulator [Streptomyces sp. NBC_01257]|uniref:MerR family transcriptional regulator n=1 Tax=Streptomyces sp. NBC_01257 TaxID=2903799 RepID=UPI002DD97289|nr:MerR family transcriptional regulator [Streptomyces sp. NBC_01257]WRZ70151.1 MerR family transcriptional regulator [Streptomyces sp. NBC_01257]